jgi:GNAT superfamily N-acetyltransferase
MADVRPASLDDAELVARVAAEGFFDDPVLSWALQDDTTRLGQLLVMFRGLVEDTLPDRGVIQVADAASVSIWRDPTFEHGKMASDRLEEAAGASDEPGPFTEDELARLEILGDAMREAHPHEPHWYLNVVSTLPSHQSRGLGAAVIQPVLDRADAEGVPCYLESTNPRNRTLYYRAGFEDMGDVELDGGPSMRQMWRAPRA